MVAPFPLAHAGVPPLRAAGVVARPVTLGADATPVSLSGQMRLGAPPIIRSAGRLRMAIRRSALGHRARTFIAWDDRSAATAPDRRSPWLGDAPVAPAPRAQALGSRIVRGRSGRHHDVLTKPI